MIFALILFLITYTLLLLLPKYRAVVALSSALIYIISGTLTFSKALSAIDFNVILMLAGTMGIVALFIESKMPALLADLILGRVPNVKWAIISLALFAGIISAFVDNVATVLMVVPVALTIAKKLNISPVPGVIAISISSNLQGAATLVGDATAILMGSHAHMTFSDFFIYQGKPGIFWVVQAGAVAFTLVCLLVFRKYSQLLSVDLKKNRTLVTDYLPSFLLVMMILLLIVVSFVPDKPALTNGFICTGLFILGLIITFAGKKDKTLFGRTLREIDISTLLLLSGLFIVVAGITEAGLVEEISKIFIHFSGDNLFIMYTLIVWVSVLFAAFIDNIPFVATMLPVISGISAIMKIDPTILYFGLLCGATLGGNFTPIGASANITAIGILRRNGYEVKTSQYMKISFPITFAAIITGYLLIWLIWN
ncbi:possible tyrosine transporter P-protein (TC 2.A.45.2.1) [Anaerocolumna jejuensis DSM 15929]|uniref:Possible tyrosine transporter P-protein (TC 2.A.45.2.1) n=1 Tax=Anaerocolumna jejuensis DSM 15929 TaxID=1121322 RepID=A0A1M6Q675_9FIRM|nr:SLC13 family permease [Anaerocolumna jejuensis]SHK15701.1 possible tyrosine transporter P-protein (TC 2.A.45.2.1) [Anaerocolumna jejuensis DSM 15929]